MSHVVSYIQGFRFKFCMLFLMILGHAACHTHLIFFDLIILIQLAYVSGTRWWEFLENKPFPM